MCGILCYWAKEANLSEEQYDILLMGAMERGQDGVGVTIIDPNTKEPQFTSISIKFVDSYMSHRSEILAFIATYMGFGKILLASCRATPETEPVTTEDMIQPIVKVPKFYLVHNGGITDSITDEFKEGSPYVYRTPLDSESIIAAYTSHGHNMKNALEMLSGSWAFIMLDMNKKTMYAATSFNPLAHMYIKGYGYFLHSNNDVLKQVLFNLTMQTTDGVNVWESWYHHYIDGYTIIETDLQSGFQRKREYTPRFLHPKWNSLDKGDGTQVFICCSGGIDSGLTAWIYKLLGYDTFLVHYKYGQKAEAAEEWAVDQLAQVMQVPYHVFNIAPFFMDPSMLLRDDIEVTSGGKDLKSTIAWVAGRNAIFSTLVMGLAESYILHHNFKEVIISAGWAQLSEETGGYPDNSFKFTQALNELKRYGYITGSRMNFVPLLQNLTKTEGWVLGHALTFPFDITVSCDNPKYSGHSDFPYLCTTCGSTKLSILASDRAGVCDPRKFFEDRPVLSDPMPTPSVDKIIDRLILSEKDKETLKGGLKIDLAIQRGS